jgi:AraC-like DNA-binding protein
MVAQRSYRSIRYGVETLAYNTCVPRHRHLGGYATVVLAGSFVESSFAGRTVAQPGDVLLHGRFDCHANTSAGRSSIRILRLPWQDDAVEGCFRVRDPDRLVTLCERDPHQAMEALAENLVAVRAHQGRWTHTLALQLAGGDPLSLRQWAHARGLRPDDISRGFRCDFGVSPKRFRLEARSRRAWGTVMHSTWSLTRIAQDHDFADLAHMSRSIQAFTGLSPTTWRKAAGSSSPQMRSS